MTWRDDLRRVTMPDGRRLIGASFRGVPFFVETGDRAGGRRAVVHEFPLREDPYVEDLGRRARVISVEGYVVGANYHVQRNALLAALEDTAGPGELVHPSYGVLRAVCTSLSTRESIADGGMAMFALEFTEAPAQAIAPTVVPDRPAAVSSAASAALEAGQAEFESAYDVDGEPAFALESLSGALSTMGEALGEALAPMTTATQELAQLNVEILSLTSQASSLVRQPTAVLAAFQDVLGTVADSAAEAPEAMVDAVLDAYEVGLDALAPAATATRVLEHANHAALVAGLRRVLVVEAATRATAVEFASLDEAVETRERILVKLDEQLEAAGDDAYPALLELRTALVAAVPGSAALAEIVTIERRVAIPSILLAYQLYGDVDREADIVARNGVRHPGFVAGELQVLTR